jgi:hypothetical protein
MLVVFTWECDGFYKTILTELLLPLDANHRFHYIENYVSPKIQQYCVKILQSFCALDRLVENSL